MKTSIRSRVRAVCRAGIATGLGLMIGAAMIASATTLSDQPVFATSDVPGNLALTLSVEYPTVSRVAHVADYNSNTRFLGYFDPEKCYRYMPDSTPNGVTADSALGDSSYFAPVGRSATRTCTGQWSGNFLNWATLTAIDPFRWAMTGGRRVLDTPTETIIEKGRNAGQGYFPTRDQTARAEGRIPLDQVAGATPFSTATALSVVIDGRGFAMRINATGTATRTMTANYFNNTTLSGASSTVLNDSAYHDWGTGRPQSNIGTDNFSARFDGTYTAPETGSYVFRTNSDDGVRVWVSTNGGGFDACTNNTGTNGNCVINNWTDHGPVIDDSVPIAMTAGQTYRVRVEYYEGGGGAVMQLLWRKPSAGIFTAFSDDGGLQDYTVRVKVCDPSAAAGGLEPNCKAYGSNYKPEGLIQQYANKMRYSAFGYLNDDNLLRDGAVLRARQKFVGPTYPVPGETPATNLASEWDANTGVLARNPDPTDATNTAGATVSDSGVMNYLNKFGQLMPGTYKAIDPVNELFYAALRYYRNLGNVPAWSDMSGASDAATRTKWVDGFPVITNWGDPIQYSCQRNFVLGIGDIYTHRDKNVPGNTLTADEPTMPDEVRSDTSVNAVTATNKVKSLQGMGENQATVGTGSSNSTDYMAGLAYDANTMDIRNDLTGKQTVQTYWVDVLEQPFSRNNKFYLAAKFGGLNQKKLPADFNPYTFAGTIPLDWWSTTGDTLTDARNTPLTQARPDNYFAAGKPETLVSGLTKAFENIVNAIQAYTTSFSLSALQIQGLGAASYASQYNAQDWTSVVSASELSFTADGTPSRQLRWTSTDKLATQLAGEGWDTNRRIATWSGSAGVPFRIDAISSGTGSQRAALDTAFVTGDDSADYLNYLRGDRSHEKTDSDATRPYRLRSKLLGDIVNAKVKPVGPPGSTYSDAVNPGYAAFKAGKAARPTMVYAGANDGMLHAFRGELTGANAGLEQFAYVPSAVFKGPSNPATPTVDGLAQLGNPNYLHRYYVDATPEVVDIDFNHAGGTFTTTDADSSDWRSLLVGGLGKGGKSFYALDVTNPGDMTDETTVASKVLWEFTDANMGFSFGSPLLMKTRRYGWVVVLTSGYNNNDGRGYLYILRPQTGEVLQKISTGAAANGLTHATAFISDLTDGTADAVYVGDLSGQLWRFDVTAAVGTSAPYPAPTKIAQFTDGASPTPRAQPITTRPLIQIQPSSRKRYVMIGTGQLLDASDINSSAAQTFYAVIDGTATAFKPADATMPVTRTELTAVTNLTTGAAIPNDALGWYMDLGSENGIGLRMVSSPTAFNGIVAFSPLLTSSDACSPSGVSVTYAIDYGTGRSALIDANGNSVAFVQYGTAVTDLKFVSVDGVVRLVSGDVPGDLRNIRFRPPAGLNLRLLNWREVPTAD
ncbi:PilC/PilY family type IV pilus protein [Variovorax sp. ZT4R33]|uniref:PilC/PilY family type IV pilus protein n=1 Tax=Variovorax sp. ZT4R33 TaxID=3443743 RepID=UPI003F46D19F